MVSDHELAHVVIELLLYRRLIHGFSASGALLGSGGALWDQRRHVAFGIVFFWFLLSKRHHFLRHLRLWRTFYRWAWVRRALKFRGGIRIWGLVAVMMEVARLFVRCGALQWTWILGGLWVICVRIRLWFAGFLIVFFQESRFLLVLRFLGIRSLPQSHSVTLDLLYLSSLIQPKILVISHGISGKSRDLWFLDILCIQFDSDQVQISATHSSSWFGCQPVRKALPMILEIEIKMGLYLIHHHFVFSWGQWLVF